MYTGKLVDNGTRNSFLDTFHRSFNGVNGDWYGSQQDATVTNHFRLGIGAGMERGLLNRYQTDLGYRWTTGLSDASSGIQYYQVLDELNHVYRLSLGQYNDGQGATNNQTALNAAGTGAVILNGSNNAGTGGVVFGSGGPSSSTVATVDQAGNANFLGTMLVGGVAQTAGTMTVRNNADAEVDYYLWPGVTSSQKGSFTYKDFNGASQWYMVKDQSNNWALNSAPGGLDSFKAYQSTNSGDTYINAAKSTGHIRLNYETGAGAETDIYSGASSSLAAAFLGPTAIKLPGLAAASGKNCVQIDSSGYLSNTNAGCGLAAAVAGAGLAFSDGTVQTSSQQGALTGQANDAAARAVAATAESDAQAGITNAAAAQSTANAAQVSASAALPSNGVTTTTGGKLQATNIDACATNGIVNPTCPAYGADSSGATDSSAAFIAAGNTGKHIHIPAGHYTIANPSASVAVINLTTAGQIIEGDGAENTILTYTGACGTTWPGNAIIKLSADNQTVRNLTLTTNKTDPTCFLTGVKIAQAGGSNATVEHSKFTHFHGTGIQNLNNARLMYNQMQDVWFGIAPGNNSLVQGNNIDGGWESSGIIPPWRGGIAAGGTGVFGVLGPDVPGVTVGGCQEYPNNTTPLAKVATWVWPCAVGSGYAPSTTITGLVPTVLTGSCPNPGVVSITTNSSGAITQAFFSTQPGTTSGATCALGTTMSIPGYGTGSPAIITIKVSAQGTANGPGYWDCVLNEGGVNTIITHNTLTGCGQSGVYVGGAIADSSGMIIDHNNISFVNNYGVDVGISSTTNFISNAKIDSNLSVDGKSGSCNFAGLDHSSFTSNQCLETVNYLQYWGLDKQPSSWLSNIRSALSTSPLVGDTVSGNTFSIYDAGLYSTVLQNIVGAAGNNEIRALNNFDGPVAIKSGATLLTAAGSSPTLLGRTKPENYPVINNAAPGGWYLAGTWTAYQPNAAAGAGGFEDSLSLELSAGGFGSGAALEWKQEIEVLSGSGTATGATPDLAGAFYTFLVRTPTNYGVVLIDHGCSGSAGNSTWDVYIKVGGGVTGMLSVSYTPYGTWSPVGTISSTDPTTLCSGTAANQLVATNLGQLTTSTFANVFNAGTHSQSFQTATSGDQAAISIYDTTDVIQGVIGSSSTLTSAPNAFSLRFAGGNAQLNSSSTGSKVVFGNDHLTNLEFQLGNLQWYDGTYTATLKRPATLGAAYAWVLPATSGTLAVTSQLPVNYSVAWTPSAATVSSCVEQTATVTGLAMGKAVSVSSPDALGTHIWPGGARVSAVNTLAYAFCADATGGTPPSGTWLVTQ